MVQCRQEQDARGRVRCGRQDEEVAGAAGPPDFCELQGPFCFSSCARCRACVGGWATSAHPVETLAQPPRCAHVRVQRGKRVQAGARAGLQLPWGSRAFLAARVPLPGRVLLSPDACIGGASVARAVAAERVAWWLGGLVPRCLGGLVAAACRGMLTAVGAQELRCLVYLGGVGKEGGARYWSLDDQQARVCDTPSPCHTSSQPAHVMQQLVSNCWSVRASVLGVRLLSASWCREAESVCCRVRGESASCSSCSVLLLCALALCSLPLRACAAPINQELLSYQSGASALIGTFFTLNECALCTWARARVVVSGGIQVGKERARGMGASRARGARALVASSSRSRCRGPHGLDLPAAP